MLPLMHRFRLQLLQCKLATFVAIGHVLLCSRCYELWQFGPLEWQGYFTFRIPQMRTGICLQLECRSTLCCRKCCLWCDVAKFLYASAHAPLEAPTVSVQACQLCGHTCVALLQNRCSCMGSPPFKAVCRETEMLRALQILGSTGCLGLSADFKFLENP